jgi:two-component system NarL family response regulator
MILIATASPDVLARCSQGLQPFGMMLTVAEYGSLKEVLVKVEAQILLLDLALPGLNGSKGVAELRKLNRLPKAVALGGALSDEMELDLFKIGVRGYCRSDVDSQQLKRIAVAVQRGELWIRRSLTPWLLDELGAQSRDDVQPTRMVAGRLVELTQREREIAALVCDGNSNKQIARRLDITERTVKAHLTEIFRKLGISDRLMLALRVMALVKTDREQIG